MKCYIGLSSNLGDRRKCLEQAVAKMRGQTTVLRTSPIFQSPAEVPKNAPDTWRISYLNAVVLVDWAGMASDLLGLLKKIEGELGKSSGPRWLPRVIDLDLLTYGNQSYDVPGLVIPHPELWNRGFVLDPLKHLQASLILPGRTQSVLERTRALNDRAPFWMGIFNLGTELTSSDGVGIDEELLVRKIEEFESVDGQIIDLGGEATRADALQSRDDEWARLKSALEILQDKRKGKNFAPWISVDIDNADIASRALGFGVEILNDVSGLRDKAMIDLLKSSTCQYILRHSTTIPADPSQSLHTDEDPIQSVKIWAREKLEHLERQGVSIDRIIFDPGVGFGKTPQQSMSLLMRVEELFDLPTRILIGHSRKSFMSLWNQRKATDRDPESIGVSLNLARRGVDILRVHEPALHVRAHLAYREVEL